MVTKRQTNQQVIDSLEALRFYGLSAHFDQLRPTEHSFVRRMLRWEEEERRRRSLEKRLKVARLGNFKQVVDFDWSWPKKCDRVLVDDLLKLEFIQEGANVVFLGPNGVGKSTLAKNIAYQAVLSGHTVTYVSASQMLNDLASKEQALALQRRLTHYARPQLLCLDELGYLSYGGRHADLLFEVVSRRYEANKSIMLTTNKPFAEWGDVFPNASCVVTLVDRIMHKADIVQVEGDSYRLKEARERRKRQKTKTSRATRRKPSAQKSRQK